MTASSHVGAENGPWVLCKSNKCSQLNISPAPDVVVDFTIVMIVLVNEQQNNCCCFQNYCYDCSSKWVTAFPCNFVCFPNNPWAWTSVQLLTLLHFLYTNSSPLPCLRWAICLSCWVWESFIDSIYWTLTNNFYKYFPTVFFFFSLTWHLVQLN